LRRSELEGKTDFCCRKEEFYIGLSEDMSIRPATLYCYPVKKDSEQVGMTTKIGKDFGQAEMTEKLKVFSDEKRRINSDYSQNVKHEPGREYRSGFFCR
jgi:hypothetical protein